MKYTYKSLIIVALAILMASCKKEFLERPSLDNPTLETYYTNAEQVEKATGLLYGSAWSNFSDKAWLSIGDVLAGSAITQGAGEFAPYMNFTVSETDASLYNAWRAFYKVAGTSTILIQAFEDKKETVGNTDFLNQGIAEAKFMRALAYFYLARIFRDVPIVTDPVELASAKDYSVPRYKQSDVLKFVIEDLKSAESVLPLNTGVPRLRVNAYSAKALMAKVYLYMKDYDNAKIKAQEVISSNMYSLYPDYYKLFSTAEVNGNPESLFALQWSEIGPWSGASHFQTNYGPPNLLEPLGSGGYLAIIPTIHLIKSFEAGDLRKKSIMQHGFHRSDWVNKNFPSGFTFDTASSDNTIKTYSETRSATAKYIVGPGDGATKVIGQSNNMQNYLLRYADVLLIYAEAVLGNNASTSDAAALSAFNQVRRRAGFTEDKVSITKDIILHERLVEFNFEGEYWFDIQRQGFDKAREILHSQERGGYNYNGSAIQHRDVKSTFVSENQLYLPIPSSEVLLNPLLRQPAVNYY